jgi:hypothetical protein
VERASPGKVPVKSVRPAVKVNQVVLSRFDLGDKKPRAHPVPLLERNGNAIFQATRDTFRHVWCLRIWSRQAHTVMRPKVANQPLHYFADAPKVEKGLRRNLQDTS